MAGLCEASPTLASAYGKVRPNSCIERTHNSEAHCLAPSRGVPPSCAAVDKRWTKGRELSNIVAPTLVIWGRNDQFASIAHAEVLRRMLPNVQVQIWDRCGHAPQIEHLEKFNQTVLEFWRSLDAIVS